MYVCDVCQLPTNEVYVVTENGSDRDICCECHDRRGLPVALRSEQITQQDADKLFATAELMNSQWLYNALWLAAAAAITAAGLVALFLS